MYLDENEAYTDDKKISYLKNLISLNNTFYDAYISLKDIYFELRMNKEAYIIILEGYNCLMKHEFNYKLPSTLDYYELNNRHIFRLLYNYADTLWFFENKVEALKIFKKLLRMHPDDNIGARYAVCGILEGYEYTNQLWNEQDQNIEKWFKENMKKHLKTKGFGWMKSYCTNKVR